MDDLWFPGLPCWLLGAGMIRLDGGDIVDYGTKEIYLRFRKDGPKFFGGKERIPKTASLCEQMKWHISFVNTEQRLALKEWPDIIGHIDLAGIKHLEKRGLVEMTNASAVPEY